MKLLILGGTGIIGTAIAKIAVKRGFEVTVTGIDKNSSAARFVYADKKSQNFCRTIAEISHDKWDAVVDVCSYCPEDALQTYNALRTHCNHLFVISTTLVYDRTHYTTRPIKTTYSLASVGIQGGYVDAKISVEKFWHNVKDVNWTILRPYHVLGPGAFLGCIPLHNRDAKLVERIRHHEQLMLCDGGRIPINVIHPDDIGEIILRATGNPQTFKKCYNAVNPEEVIARDYYLELGRQIGEETRIRAISGEEIWAKHKQWQLTTLPHMYDVSDLESDIGYVPNTPISACIKDAIKQQPTESDIHKRMNKPPKPILHKYFQKT